MSLAGPANATTDRVNSNNLSRAETAPEANAPGDVHDVVFPVVFVLDGDVADEFLALELVENGGNVRNTSAIRDVMGVRRFFIQVLEVNADDATIQDFEAFNRIQSRTHPMADVRCGANARVAVLDDAQDIVGIPHFIAGIVRLAGMIMETHTNIVLLDEFFDGVNGVYRFCGDAIKFKFLGEL